MNPISHSIFRPILLISGLLAGLVICLSASGAMAQSANDNSVVNKLRELVPSLGADHLPDWIAKSNGRIEGQEIQISTRYPGRLAEVLVSEGDIVEAGEIIARIDDREYRAQLLGAEANVLRAEAALALAEAQLDQANSDRELAQTSANRSVKLFENSHISAQLRDESLARLKVAEASERAAKAQIASAKSAIAVASASVSQLNAVLSDMILTAPRRGRVQYQLSQAGEVVGAGARVVTIIDLTDISMSIYLTANEVARLSVGDEARIIIDPVPEYVIPARITFIAPEAQFTPKMVETADERENLVFRVKIQLPRDLLKHFEDQVKVGVRGVGFVRTDIGLDWPEQLNIQLPE